MRRRARPLLGTLVEVAATDTTAIEVAFAAVAEVHARMSRHSDGSDVGRFHALAVGRTLRVAPCTAEVLAAARELEGASDGLFDAGDGSGAQGWTLAGTLLRKAGAAARLDLDGIAKGYAVDCAIAALQAAGCERGWVNAGGDLRVFGACALPIRLRDEAHGGVRAFATLRDGAFATSYSARWHPRCARRGCPARHVSVAAPQALWADALTKVVALSGDAAHPLLARYAATAWIHR
jgi:FAD:protein FMN transferase